MKTTKYISKHVGERRLISMEEEQWIETKDKQLELHYYLFACMTREDYLKYKRDISRIDRE